MTETHANGWSKLGSYEESPGGGRYGDYVIGNPHVALYHKSGTEWMAEVGYWVEATDVHEDDPRNGTFGVQCCVEIWRNVEDQPDEQVDLETSYDFGDVRCFHDIEAAQTQVARLAAQDESYIFNV